MRNSQNSLLLGRFKAGVLTLLVFLALGLICCAVLLKKEAPSGLYFPLLLAAAGVSGVFGGVFATRKERKNGLINGASAAVLPIVAYLTAAVLLNRGFALGSLLPCLTLLCCSVAAGIAAANRKKTMKIKKRK